MNVPKEERVAPEVVSEVYQKHAGNVSAVARELGISRSSVRRLTDPKLQKKPLAGGTIEGTPTIKRPLPKKGKIARYILTSAQNNTYVHQSALNNLEALAEHYKAEIIVGTFTYNQNAYGPKAIKKDSWQKKVNAGAYDELWYDPKLADYIKDNRIELGNGLVWCGEYNSLPTNVRPLASLESYSGRKSAIFPHAKLAMRSIASNPGEGVKLNFTTGAVTQRNYIQKREGMIAEFHHVYGGLIVEVNSDGNWWVRQLNEDDKGVMYDLDIKVENGKVTKGHRIEAVTHGDLHATWADPVAIKLAQNIVDTLKPRFQFHHDIMEGAAVQPHHRKYKANHEKFHTWLRGYHRVENELLDTSKILQSFERPFSEDIIPDANHDDIWLKRWLREHDHRVDPPNVELFLDLQAFLYNSIRNGVTEEQSRARTAKPKMVRDVHVLEYAIKKYGKYTGHAKFLTSDQSFKTCGGKIENGMHGHLGPAGKFGTPESLSQMGRKANTAHTHATGIFNGLYVAGTLSKLRWDYAKGPTNWTQSEILTYENGKRAIVTFYNGKWRA